MPRERHISPLSASIWYRVKNQYQYEALGGLKNKYFPMPLDTRQKTVTY
jgi:hypothetical protein